MISLLVSKLKAGGFMVQAPGFQLECVGCWSDGRRGQVLWRVLSLLPANLCLLSSALTALPHTFLMVLLGCTRTFRKKVRLEWDSKKSNVHVYQCQILEFFLRNSIFMTFFRLYTLREKRNQMFPISFNCQLKYATKGGFVRLFFLFSKKYEFYKQKMFLSTTLQLRN